MSGFDGAILTTLLQYKNSLAKIKKKPGKFTPVENMMAVLDQEILNKITL